MAEGIILKVYTPEKLAINKEVYRVVLPDGRQNLTVIADRAPTSLIIEAGILQILDKNDKVAEWYFIDTGIADIAKNECKISTLHLSVPSKMSKESAQELQTKDPENAKYYAMIIKHYTDYPE